MFAASGPQMPTPKRGMLSSLLTSYPEVSSFQCRSAPLHARNRFAQASESCELSMESCQAAPSVKEFEGWR
eukprot:1364176-Prorocentrum_lima.AAC.1